MKTAVKSKPVKAKQEVPARNAFAGKKEAPTDSELASALGLAKPLWDHVISALMAQSAELAPEWKCSVPKLGWALRLQQKKRTIVYLSPCVGSFRVGFVFGERALVAAREANLPRRILDLIAAAPRYAEGTGIRMEVTEQDIFAICKLTKIKIQN